MDFKPHLSLPERREAVEKVLSIYGATKPQEFVAEMGAHLSSPFRGKYDVTDLQKMWDDLIGNFLEARV